ncbi:MAG: L-seryl-tRNA(Sec) selenium transferase [Hespellia sp.]|nr:L-seryl-tRNA(Sec) selenium transferase [Hespellia sp.]
MENRNSWYRRLPKVDILIDTEFSDEVEQYGKSMVTVCVNQEISRIREVIPHLHTEAELMQQLQDLHSHIKTALAESQSRHFRRVINATGVILHTNLGRAPLPEEIVTRAMQKLTGYTNLEYNLQSGERGERYAHFEEMICQITGAEAAFAVNNNAAAVLLMMSALGQGREIIVSRGEQIEIGGKFRIPDIMDQSGCHRVEVGTTNKTRLSDYEEALTENTAALLKVHTSNFRIEGFTENVSRQELVTLAQQYQIPVMEDLGSGVLIDLSRYGIKREPTVMDSLAAGVDLVSFSGDKLLGGPQAGIIVGKRKWVDLCKKHPLTRAMRVDKFTVAILEEIFALYQDFSFAISKIPVLSMLTADEKALRKKADRFCAQLAGLPSDYHVRTVVCESAAGGGSLPGEVLPSVGVRIENARMQAGEVQSKLHQAEEPLILRVENQGLLLDMRTLFPEELDRAAKLLKDQLK